MLNKKVMIVSLGCDKNLVDTEKMLGILANEGCTFTDDEAQAQVIIVNTCCFIGDAKEESIQNILDLARFKTEGKLEALIATGCLSQRYQDEMLEELPELDGILGISAWHTIADVVREALEGKRPRNLMSTGVLNSHTTKRLLTTGGHYAYLKIAEGCNKRCTYCVIPSVRGAYVSVPMEELEKEARELAAEGVKELILVAQETTVYGIDLYKKKMLPELLHRLCAIPGIVWIRLLYCYPEEITPELVQVMKEEKKICHYLDMPIQHSSDRILKKMGRRTNRKELLDKIEMLRTEIPDIVLRTTLITGFPGETQEDFEEMLSFVDMVGFERLGVFPYSPEEGTPAAEMEDQIDEEVKKQRRDAIMELQQEISFDFEADCVGEKLLVMIEGYLPDEHAYVGRTYMDAPGIDGYIFIKSGEALMSGDFAEAIVTGSDEYDLIGELYEEHESAE